MNDRQQKKILSASALQQAVLLDNTDEGSNDIEITPEFSQRISSLFTRFEKKKKSRTRIYKIAASFILVLSITFGTVMSIDATRSDFIHFFQRYFAFNSGKTESWNTNFNSQILDNVHDVFLPTWVPEGFTAIGSSQTNNNCTITYQLADKSIRLSQSMGTEKMNSDNELKGMSEIKISGHKYYYTESEALNQIIDLCDFWQHAASPGESLGQYLNAHPHILNVENWNCFSKIGPFLLNFIPLIRGCICKDNRL